MDREIHRELRYYYQLLGLDENADPVAIRKAYYARAKEMHPDVSEHDIQAMQQLNRAYRVLSGREILQNARAASQASKPNTTQKFRQVALQAEAAYSADASEPGFMPEHIISSGWRASGKLPVTLNMHFPSSVLIKSFSAEALPLPYHVKRENMHLVEIHQLFALSPEGDWQRIAEFRLDTAGDRDIAWTFEQAVGPVEELSLTCLRAAWPPGWKNLRIFGYYAKR